MTVGDMGGLPTMVRCYWFVDQEVKVHEFHQESLKPVDPASQAGQPSPASRP
jgi:uncharacterized protein YodC (DUF2158 family)